MFRRAAYHSLARLHHPDKSGSDGQAFVRLRQAYETLSDAPKRAMYDDTLRRELVSALHR